MVNGEKDERSKLKTIRNGTWTRRRQGHNVDIFRDGVSEVLFNLGDWSGGLSDERDGEMVISSQPPGKLSQWDEMSHPRA